MKINIYVEDFLFFKYIGCATAARTIFTELDRRDGIEIARNSHEDGFDITHYHTFGPWAQHHRRRHGGMAILTAHSTPRINAGNIAFSTRINAMYPKIYRKFDHIITISEPCQREITTLVPGVPTTLIPNGIDREFFRPKPEKGGEFRESCGIADDEKVVLVVAQQTPRKGIYDFFNIAERCPDIKWVWVGGFPYGILSKDYTRIKKMKQNEGGNIVFPGIVDDISAAYNAADIFFMPSYAETFGLVILEAMACGLPVIARDIAEFKEIFGDSVQLFSDLESAAAMVRDEDALRELARVSRDATAPFDITLIADLHLQLYRELSES